ncbi:MAG: DNA polymerase III subunit alpha [Bacteroidetes bacterium]|nr:DNA polymerase III subunit alpha [Bacteroidota bacterium]
MPIFSHLHVHTQYSLLDGAARISDLYKKAIADKMPAVAITDHGNMFGVFEFVAEAWKHKDANGKPIVKPIVGCEFYLVEDRHAKTFTKENKDQRYHQLLLAKNETGYRNLTKLCSLGYIEGLYSKYPRIDKELVLKYHEGLIATSCCLAAEIPRTILRKGEAEAEELLKWWIDLFGEDFYIELQRHNIPDQIKVNEVLLKFAQKYNLKVIASNDSHYTEREDASAHDILLCINTNAKVNDPKAVDFSEDSVSKSGRFAFANDEFYFKNQGEMNALFHDIPEAIDNTNEIVDKIETLKLTKDILLPDFPIPNEFKIHNKSETLNGKEITHNVLNQWEYLKHLTYEGAQKRYGSVEGKVKERIDFELHTIKTMGFAGYFLIVSDFIVWGKNNGVYIGPGRGSAAGSAVAYCIGITNIDPIKYELLFERFLNPDRASMPDIDTDFDDEGRQRVLQYVTEKYGRNQVANIITYGTMAAKTSIRDTARTMDLNLKESDYLAKLIPDRPVGLKFNDLYERPLTGNDEEEESLESKGVSTEDLQKIKELRSIISGDPNDLRTKVLTEARKLEGSVRNVGVHAAGVIIAPKDLSDIIPVATAKDSDLYVTQYEGNVIESAGVIKMDFLGLKTLSILRDAIKLLKAKKGITIDLDELPLDDKKTFELYKKGRTIGTFQFESPAMQKHLRDLKPDRLGDLIAMNALYRPGPMQYIDSFIARKQGKEPITYDLPEMEEYLAETYGVTVYQEQVMLLSQKLAGFTKGEADNLRKAMGKKQIEIINKMEEKFIAGTSKNGFDKKICEKIWNDWKKFALYAFNKSHSTCYAIVAYQTAYLKAHYPAEYMATVLSHNLNDLSKLSFFMDECKSMGLDVLGPDINESDVKFSVNKQGAIRFGLSGLSGVGEGASEAIVLERETNGPYEDAFDLVKRVKSKQLNKRVLDSLARSGAFDFDKNIHRTQYFHTVPGEATGIDILLKYATATQEAAQSSQASLFGGESNQLSGIGKPKMPALEPLPKFTLLEEERRIAGLFLSSHPLDLYDAEITATKVTPLAALKDTEKLYGKRLLLAFYVLNVKQMMGKNNKPFMIVDVEDKSDSHTFRFYDNDFVNFGKNFSPQTAVYMVMEFAKKSYKKDGQDKVFIKTQYYEFGMLQDLAKNKISGLEILFPADYTDSERLDDFIKIIKENKGHYSLNITFIAENYVFQTRSEKYNIGLNNKLLKKLNELGAEVKISTRSL